MADLQCQVDIPKDSGEEAVKLTVGKIFFLRCEGEWPTLKPDAVELRLDPENVDRLKLLGFEFTSKTQAQLTVTSYKVGQHQLKAVQLVDPEHSVVLGDLNFVVESVMNPQEPKQEPYGPMGPLGLSLSLWYPLALILIVVFLATFLFLRVRQRRQKARLLSEMRLQEYVMEPFFQFYQSARKMQRKYAFFNGAETKPEETQQFVSELDQAYKIYLARKFQVPTLFWRERKILSDLKRHHREFYSDFRLEVRKSLAELSRAMKDKKGLSGKDCQQLFEMIRKQVDQMDSALKSKGGA